jgi:hypothetical protein
MKTREKVRRHSQVVRQRIANPSFPSSNLGAASLFLKKSYTDMGAWWNGRHDGLKIRWSRDCGGSSPPAPNFSINNNETNFKLTCHK